jgi:hypothetical protein
VECKPAFTKYFLAGGTIVAAVLIGVIIGFRNNDFVQNVFFIPTKRLVQARAQMKTGRVQLMAGCMICGMSRSAVGLVRLARLRSTIPSLEHESVKITFLQIGQEVGLLGLGLFIAMCVYVGRMLWQVRAQRIQLALVIYWPVLLV